MVKKPSASAGAERENLICLDSWVMRSVATQQQIAVNKPQQNLTILTSENVSNGGDILSAATPVGPQGREVGGDGGDHGGEGGE